MDNNQNASSYAIAKVLGYNKSFEQFIEEYSQYYEETLQSIKSQTPTNTVQATQNPFRTHR